MESSPRSRRSKNQRDPQPFVSLSCRPHHPSDPHFYLLKLLPNGLTPGRLESHTLRHFVTHTLSLSLAGEGAKAPVEATVQGFGWLPAVDGRARGTYRWWSGFRRSLWRTREVKWLNHYSSAQSILIVGDGDLSFSLALAAALGPGAVNIVATSLESYEAPVGKYSKAESIVMELKRMGAEALHGIDAKMMKHNAYLEMKRFDCIVFNFPYAGFNGKENAMLVIRSHMQLVMGFLANARGLLQPYGEIHISHEKGPPYDAWCIELIASESAHLTMIEKVGFQKQHYPGYNQKRGDGAKCDESFPLGDCCTFKFRL